MSFLLARLRRDQEESGFLCQRVPGSPRRLFIMATPNLNLLAEIPALSFPACPNLEQALGYDPTFNSEVVSFFYVPGCSMLDDGHLSFSGYDWNYVAFENMCRHHLDMRRFYFGSDEGPNNTHRFILERSTRKLYILPEQQARDVLHRQWQNQPNIIQETFDRLSKEVGEALARELIGQTLFKLTARPFDFLGTNLQIQALREEMLAWYEQFFKQKAATKTVREIINNALSKN